ncbi:TonB-dependent receptor [Bacterioplanes sanyensis]|uniref:TonB-dependent receptor n=2 Tax=Bacterioplanes sanyensis TaxID=1249553 RepID=A0A222FPP1_9GAMM|nr:TonB-dependent receptor [Bacterioplanes sanyensis]
MRTPTPVPTHRRPPGRQQPKPISYGFSSKPVAAMLVLLSAHGANADGILEGRVINAAGDGQLTGAVVRIEELQRETLAGQGGRFRLPSLKAGEYTLSVHLGQQQLDRRSIVINDDQITREHIVLSADALLEEVLVIGQAAQMQRALDRQRYADNLINAVNADAIGQLPDNNAAEALQRVPGISIERDQGEGRFVRVRGISPDLNSVSVNGTQLPAPEAGRRAVALDVLPADLISSLVVTKALTPDMDANAIGGSIEVESISALDRDGLFYTVRAEASYDQLTEQTSPAYALTAGNTFELARQQRLGIAAAFSYDQHKFGSDNVETGAAWDLSEQDAALEELEQRDYRIERERLGAALNMDYQLSTNHRFFWRSLYSSFRDDEQRLANVIEFGELSASDEPGEFEFDGKARAAGETGLAEVKRELKDREETQEILASTLGGEHFLGAWTVEYAVGYSQAKEDEPSSLDGAVFKQENVGGMGFTNSRKPRLISSDDYVNSSAYELDDVEYSQALTEDTHISGRLDISRDLFIGRYPALLKFGAKSSQREKTQRIDEFKFEDWSDHGISDAQLTLDQYLSASPDYELGRFGPGISSGAVRGLLTGLNKNDFFDAEASRAASYDIHENIYAAYVMGRIEMDAWMLLAGVRHESTQQDFDGTGVDGDGNFTAIDDDHHYGHTLPSLHARYELLDGTQIRASWTQAVVRPTFEQMSPSFVDDGEEAELGNTQLNAMQANNLDLSVEHYMGTAGVVSAALFYKDIRDFIFATDLAGSSERWQDYDEVATYRNGDDASITGLELAYSQKMNQLPAPLDGVLIAANLTVSDSEADIVTFDGGNASRRSIDLPNQSDVTGNIIIGYEKHGLMLRLASNYKSQYLLEVEDLASKDGDVYQDAQTQIDFSSSYNLTEQLKLTFDIANVTDEPYYTYQRNERYNAQYEQYGPTYRLGLSYSHF